MKSVSVDKYLSSIDPADRIVLEDIRIYIHKLVPEIEEKISYGLAAFYYKDKYLIAFGAFKNHLSIFPGGLVGRFKAKLAGHKTTRGSIHFTASNPIDKNIIKEIILFRKSTIDNN